MDKFMIGVVFVAGFLALGSVVGLGLVVWLFSDVGNRRGHRAPDRHTLPEPAPAPVVRP